MNNIETLLDLIANGTHAKKNKKTKKMEQVPYKVKDFEKCAVNWFNRSILAERAIKGKCCCVTCNKCHDISESNMQCGHYVENDFTEGKFDPLNVDPQCIGCNLMGKGNKLMHTLAKIQQVGEDNIEKFIADRRKSRKKLGELKYIEIFYDSWKAVNHAREDGKTGNIDAWTLSALEKKLINIIESNDGKG